MPRRAAEARGERGGAAGHPRHPQQAALPHRHRQGEERQARPAARRQQHEVHGELKRSSILMTLLAVNTLLFAA